LSRGTIPVEFIANVCSEYGICGEWILSGRGTMLRADRTAHELAEATPRELCDAIARLLAEHMDMHPANHAHA